MKTVTYQAHAYKGNFYEMEELLSGEHMPTIWDWDSDSNLKIGTATVTVTFFEDAEIHKSELAILNRQLSVTRAENQKRENAILDQISKLSSLTYESA